MRAWHRGIRRAIWTSLVLLAAALQFQGLCYGSPYVPNEVLVFFKPGAVSLPDGVTGGTPDEFSYASPEVELTVEGLGIERMDRAVPSFEPGQIEVLSVSGEPVTLPYDLSNLYRVTLSDTSVTSVAAAFANDSLNVLFAHPNWLLGADYAPTDSLYLHQWSLDNTGQFYTPGTGVDMNVQEAWNLSPLPLPAVPVAVLDGGVDALHPDLAPIATGRAFFGDGSGAGVDGLSSSHGTAVAGIIGAHGNNRIGVAGVNWSALIVPARLSTGSDPPVQNVIDALNWVRVENIPVANLSYSWPGGEDDIDGLGAACANARVAGVLVVASMGNTRTNERRYPAANGTVLAVGAVFLDGRLWDQGTTQYPGCVGSAGSTWGDWVDIVAPGGDMVATTRSTSNPNYPGGYDDVTGSCTQGFGGTSAAAPNAAGVASLLKAKRPELNADDLEEVLERTATKIPLYPGAFNDKVGWGLVNARAAMEMVSPPNLVQRGTATGGWSDSVTSLIETNVLSGCHWGRFWAIRHKVRFNVTFPTPFPEAPTVWIRGGQTKGWSDKNPHSDVNEPGFGYVIPGSVTNTGFAAYTYVYRLYLYLNPGYEVGWCPTQAWNAAVAWTAVGPTHATPDVAQSFYAPQSGSSGSPTEGAAALNHFRVCPNNDGVFPGANPRIKVVVRDTAGNGIAGIAAPDIYMLFNGGTPQLPPQGQGFRGVGADSIIADDAAASCPNVRVVQADGPTDATGTTYISFKGAGGVRDPARKWGHFDSDIPVYVYWHKLQGRITSEGTPNSYVLRIRNVDVIGGLNATSPDREVITGADVSQILARLNQPPGPWDWWYDLDNSGGLAGGDVTTVLGHLGHDCDTPGP